MGGLRRGLPLSPPSVVGFPPRRADFPRMIWKVVPSSYRFLLCGVSRQRPPPSRCGSAGCLALAASFLSSAWVFPLCCGTPRQQETQTYEGPQNGAGLLEHDLSVYFRSQLVLRPRLHRYDLHCGPFLFGMLKTSETSGGPAPHPPSQDDVLLAMMFRIRCRFSLPHGNTLFQAFRCLAAPGDSPSRLFQPSRLQ